MGACRAWRDGAASDSCPSIWWRCRGSAAGSPWSNCGDGWRIGQSTVKAKPGFGPRLLLEPAFGDRIARKRLERLHDCQPLPTHAPRALLRHCSASRFKCPCVRLLHDARPLRKRFFALHSDFRSWPGVWQLPQMIADAPRRPRQKNPDCQVAILSRHALGRAHRAKNLHRNRQVAQGLRLAKHIVPSTRLAIIALNKSTPLFPGCSSVQPLAPASMLVPAAMHDRMRHFATVLNGGAVRIMPAVCKLSEQIRRCRLEAGRYSTRVYNSRGSRSQDRYGSRGEMA